MALTGNPSAGGGTPGMPPVTTIALGFVVVFGALRFNGFDLLFDPVGWGMCAAGASRLQRSPEGPFARAEAAAMVMIFVSLAALLSPSPGAGRGVTESAAEHVIEVVDTLGSLIALWLVVEAVVRRLRSCGKTSRAARLDVLRWAVAGLGALALPAGYGYAIPGPATAIAWFTALVVLIVMLIRSARLPCLSPGGKPVAS
ncbi:hypothetical protein [Nonomuraea sp. SYSU D8015]|uniref:hypothetical protein n=1 Tax=Nonomuraea sp. SYSU D8015 TaxID=2593644 RepID=UPI001660DA91|nr:hypothetical protein [Nonomuraea sp. SYSU D8015]